MNGFEINLSKAWRHACRVDDVTYQAPLGLHLATVAVFCCGGALTAWAFEAGLGDPTWAVSTGLGACMAAAIYEVGRPARLSVEEAQALEAQWRDFGEF